MSQKRNIVLTKEDSQRENFDLEAFRAQWEQLSDEDKQYHLNLQSDEKKYKPLLFQAIRSQFPLVDVFEFLYEQADKKQKTRILNRICYLDSWYSPFSFLQRRYEQSQKEDAFISIISKVIELDNQEIIKNYKDQIYNLTYSDSIFVPKYGEKSGYALFEFICDAVKSDYIDDAILAFYIDALSLGVNFHYDRLNQFRFVLEGDEYPLSKATFETLDDKYLEPFESEWKYNDFVNILRTPTFLDPEKNYFQLMLEKDRIQTLVNIINQCAISLKSGVQITKDIDDLFAFKDELFGTPEARANFPPALQAVMFDVFSYRMEEDEKQEIIEELRLHDEVESSDELESGIFSQQQWPGYKDNFLDKLFGQEPVNPDFEAALDHIARHASHHLDTRWKTKRAELGRLKLNALEELFAEFQKIADDYEELSDKMTHIKQCIGPHLESNEGQALWVNRGGFFGAYKKYSRLMDRLHRPHYGFKYEAETRTTARSKLEFCLIEAFDAASDEIERLNEQNEDTMSSSVSQ